MLKCWVCERLTENLKFRVCGRCYHLSEKEKLTVENIEEVLIFLRSLNIKTLTVRNMLKSACVHTLQICCSDENFLIENEIIGYKWRTLQGLYQILEKFVRAHYIPTIIREVTSPSGNPQKLLQLLKDIGFEYLFCITLLICKKYWEKFDKTTIMEYGADSLMNPFKIKEVLTETLTIAEFIPIKLSSLTNPQHLAYSHLKTFHNPVVRSLQMIEVRKFTPLSVMKLMLCHELVHCSLWFSKPYVSTGKHSYEEILCHAVMDVYVDRNIENIDPENYKFVVIRRARCVNDAINRNKDLWKFWSLLAKNGNGKGLMSNYLDNLSGLKFEPSVNNQFPVRS